MEKASTLFMDKQLKRANYLYRSGFYSRALQEYKAFLSRYPLFSRLIKFNLELCLTRTSEPAETFAEVVPDGMLLSRRQRRPLLLAYYLPQFHPIPENDEWWGEGFTEWNNVSRAKPFYPSHIQPRRPAQMGFYDLRVPSAMNKQFTLARRYGIDGFCFYYYWFNGKKLLERPLQMLMSGETDPFPFCICWVNESWTRSWDGMSGEVLVEANQSVEGTKAFIRDIESILKDPNYIRLDDKPVLLVYCPDKLEDPLATIKDWRAFATSSGIGDLHLCAVQSFGFDDPLPLGFDAAVEFPPHCVWNKHEGITYCRDYTDEQKAELGVTSDFKGVIRDYQFFAECATKRPIESYLLYRCAMLAWDNTARRMENSHIYAGFSVNTFKNWLASSMALTMRDPKTSQQDSLVFVNAWNEWAEGCTLEPDQHFGHALLRATRIAKEEARWIQPLASYKNGLPVGVNVETDSYNIIVFGHDAHPFGAQINLLSMVRVLTKKLKHKVHVVLLEGGPLSEQYRRVAPTSILSEAGDAFHNNPDGIISLLNSRGFDRAILNTTTCGRMCHHLNSKGIHITCLIHELPSLIKAYALEETLKYINILADDIVFSSEYSRSQHRQSSGLNFSASRVMPQGINFNPHYNNKQSVRHALREKLGVPQDSILVMGCGYGDYRKGIDIFCRVAHQLVQAGIPIFFVWVGRIEPALMSYVESDLEKGGLSSSVILAGEMTQPFDYYLASDIFLLTSREDPFPSVVLEAFDAGLPVIGFESAGGFAEILEGKKERGRLVKYLDERAMVSAVLELREVLASGLSFEDNHSYARAMFNYENYLNALLRVTPHQRNSLVLSSIAEPPRVTAIIPNFNYKRYLGSRLHTVVTQTYPVERILFLDDCSRDGSIDYAEGFLSQYNIPYLVIPSESNSGNTFAQWRKGISFAQTDFVWMAEADDYAEPVMLEELATLVVKNSAYNPMIAFCESWMVDAEGKVGNSYLEYHRSINEISGSLFTSELVLGGFDFIVHALGVTNIIPNASACLLNTAKLKELQWDHICELKLSGDWKIYLYLAAAGCVVFSPKVLNYHRRHALSVVNSNLAAPIDLAREASLVHEEVYAICASSPELDSLRERSQHWRNRVFEVTTP